MLCSVPSFLHIVLLARWYFWCKPLSHRYRLYCFVEHSCLYGRIPVTNVNNVELNLEDRINVYGGNLHPYVTISFEWYTLLWVLFCGAVCVCVCTSVWGFCCFSSWKKKKRFFICSFLFVALSLVSIPSHSFSHNISVFPPWEILVCELICVLDCWPKWF